MAFGTAAALLASGAISTAGQLLANQRTLDQQQLNNQLSVNLANTAHQREVLDLRAAGLNPVLSASGAGASVPQLGTTDFQNPGEGLSRGLSSAVRVSQLEEPMKESQIAVNAASARNLEAQNSNLHAQNDLLKAQADEVRSRIPNNRYPGLLAREFALPFGHALEDVWSSFSNSAKSFIPRDSDGSVQWLPSGSYIDKFKSAVKDAFRPPRDEVMQRAFREQHKRRSQH